MSQLTGLHALANVCEVAAMRMRSLAETGNGAEELQKTLDYLGDKIAACQVDIASAESRPATRSEALTQLCEAADALAFKVLGDAASKVAPLDPASPAWDMLVPAEEIEAVKDQVRRANEVAAFLRSGGAAEEVLPPDRHGVITGRQIIAGMQEGVVVGDVAEEVAPPDQDSPIVGMKAPAEEAENAQAKARMAKAAAAFFRPGGITDAPVESLDTDLMGPDHPLFRPEGAPIPDRSIFQPETGSVWKVGGHEYQTVTGQEDSQSGNVTGLQDEPAVSESAAKFWADAHEAMDAEYQGNAMVQHMGQLYGAAEGEAQMRGVGEAGPPLGLADEPGHASARADDKQFGGRHYKNMPIQPWAIMQAVLTPEEFRGFLKGNVLKYSLRAGRKPGSEDLEWRKCGHYLEKLHEMLNER